MCYKFSHIHTHTVYFFLFYGCHQCILWIFFFYKVQIGVFIHYTAFSVFQLGVQVSENWLFFFFLILFLFYYQLKNLKNDLRYTIDTQPSKQLNKKMIFISS